MVPEWCAPFISYEKLAYFVIPNRTKSLGAAPNVLGKTLAGDSDRQLKKRELSE
jgi:hypothetical protein